MYVNTRKVLVAFVVLLVGAAMAAGCAGSSPKDDQDPTAEGGLPAYFEEIPADTFFFVGGSEPVPTELVASTLEKIDMAYNWWSEYEKGFDSYEAALEQQSEAIAEMEGEAAAKMDDAAADEDEDLWIVEQMGGDIDAEGLQELGLSANPRIAAYMVGSVGVARISLSDADKFGAFVDELESLGKGVDIGDGEHEGVSYRRYQNAGEVILLRWDDHEAVAALMVEESEEVFTPYFVGAKKPETSLADDNVFERVAERNGFLPYAAGYFDFERFISYSAGAWEPTGVSKELLADADLEMHKSEECKADYIRLASMVPRFVGGMRHYDATSTDVAFGVELDEDLARELAATVTGTPGHETDIAEKSLFELGFGVDLGKMLDFAVGRARDIQMEPFQCQELAEFNQNAQMLVASSGQVPPSVRKLAGFNVLLRNLELDWDSPASKTSAALIVPRAIGALRTDDPEAFMFLVSQFFPQAQKLQVKSDGKPVKLPIPPDAYEGLVEPLLLMTQRGLAISLGPTMVDNTRRVLDATEGATSPAMVMRLNLGDPARELLDSISKLIDEAEAEKDARELSDDQIQGARNALAVMKDVLPEGPWRAALTTEFSDNGVLFAYRDEGPALDFDWDKLEDSATEADFDALERVLGGEASSSVIVEEPTVEPSVEPMEPVTPAE
jgi:hypothetical protein